ncbi:hypothetical protein AX17_003843 [Amanita inopinata Kibby_2008]|nr:hypothetical protein AX17_003843 [Amanita inopinata Kibby_2008]
MANVLERKALHVARQETTSTCLREGLRIVKDVIKNNISPSGLTTTEIFRLAVRSQPSPSFEPPFVPENEPPFIPHPYHPVRSVKYLKKKILPVLEGNGVIRMRNVTRNLSPLASASEQDASKAARDASAASSARQHIWAWIPVDQRTLPKPKIPQPERPVFGAQVGVGEDWSHLNRRRQRARVEKVARDVLMMKETMGQMPAS